MNTALALAIDTNKWGNQLHDFHQNSEDFWLDFDPAKQWMCGYYYDGPLTGICKYNGQYVFYSISDITPEFLRPALHMHTMDREYAVYEMTDEQVERAKVLHLRQYNRMHAWDAFQNCFKGRAKVPHPYELTQVEQTAFDDELMENAIIGWFRG